MEPTINKIENGNPTYKKNISKEDDNISINNEKMEDEENIELNKLEGINKNMIVNATFSRLSHFETPYLNEQQSIISNQINCKKDDLKSLYSIITNDNKNYFNGKNNTKNSSQEIMNEVIYFIYFLV